MTQPAIFLDRDGVINKDVGYIVDQDHFHYIKGVFNACRKLQKMGYLLVVVTNQSVIARGLCTEDQFLSLTEWMDWNFSDNEIELDGIYYCPHHPDGVITEFAIHCDCRKPKPGMLLQAQKELNIDMAHSFMVGDKGSDLIAAKHANVGTLVLVESDYPLSEQERNIANIVVHNLAEFANNLPTYLQNINNK